MFDIYKRTVSMILWGINLVNMVKLADSKEQIFSDFIYAIILFVLIFLLIYFIFKNYASLKRCRPNYYALVIIFLLNFFLIKLVISATIILNPIIFIFYLIGNILLIVSLFFEIKD